MTERRCRCKKSYIAIDDADTLLGPCTVLSGFKDLYDDTYKCIYCGYILTGYDIYVLKRERERRKEERW
jgi:hypothetical protein